MTHPIPIEAAQHIAEAYGYDQVIIIARKVGGPEHVTTYGVDGANAGVAARIGAFIRHKIMLWDDPGPGLLDRFERYKAVIDFAAVTMSSDWPERCREIVSRARKALQG